VISHSKQPTGASKEYQPFERTGTARVWDIASGRVVGAGAVVLVTEVSCSLVAGCVRLGYDVTLSQRVPKAADMPAKT
jgi:hypothetical protein